MKIAILGSRGGWHEAQLERALLVRGATPILVPVTGLTARLSAAPRLTVQGQDLDNCGAIIVRAIPGGSLEQVILDRKSVV